MTGGRGKLSVNSHWMHQILSNILSINKVIVILSLENLLSDN